MSYADDRAEIEDLMARYLFALDFFDADAYAATFTEDGVLDWAMGEVRGRAAIRAEAATMKAKMAGVFGGDVMIRHFATNIAITINCDSAETRAAWFEAYREGADTQPRFGTFGHYEDQLARIDGRWLFKRRRIVNEFIPGREAGPANPLSTMEPIP
jgi:hypothetical protein